MQTPYPPEGRGTADDDQQSLNLPQGDYQNDLRSKKGKGTRREAAEE